MHTILGHFDLGIDFWPHFYVFPVWSISILFSYITANFPQMCLMLDQFLWGHSSRVCDISCKFDFRYSIPEVSSIFVFQFSIFYFDNWNSMTALT